LIINKVGEKGKLIWQYPKMRGVLFGQVLFTAGSLANVDAHDERNWGNDFFAINYQIRMIALDNFWKNRLQNS
jgi:hypothetical protein